MGGKWLAVLLPNGKYLTRGRFDAGWDAAFEVDRPELWPHAERARVEALAKSHGAQMVDHFLGVMGAEVSSEDKGTAE